MKAQLLCLALMALAVSAFEFPEDPLFSTFQNFTSTYGKKYHSTEEFLIRFANFKATLQRIEKLNKPGGARFGINKFADLSPEEFKATYLNYKPSGLKNFPVVEVPRDFVAPDSVDWRTKKGIVSAVKDQGQCGSCWAFSTTEEVESQWAMAGNPAAVLAPQQIVDCDTVDQGCNGGDTVTAYQYLEQAGGLEAESSYPYQSGESGSAGSCMFNSSLVVAKISGFTYATPGCQDSCNNQNEDQLASSLAAKGPVSICVYAESWQSYTGGIYNDAAGCPNAYSDLDHCVQLVGYGSEDGQDYWIVRNSWAETWGEQGYIRLIRGSNMCGVADEATIATI